MLKFNRKLLTTLGLSIALLLQSIVPVMAQTSVEDNPKQLIHDNKKVTIEGKEFDIANIPEVKEGQKYDLNNEGVTVLKETINDKIMLHVIKVEYSNEAGLSAQATSNLDFSTQANSYTVNYTVQDWYDWTMVGTAELDTTWYTGNGEVTEITHHGWGSVPIIQLPSYWSNDGSDAYIRPDNRSEALSYAYLTDHYILGGVPVGYTTYYLETDVNSNGGYNNRYTLVKRV